MTSQKESSKTCSHSEQEPSLDALYVAIERLIDHFSDHPDAARLLVT